MASKNLYIQKLRKGSLISESFSEMKFLSLYLAYTYEWSMLEPIMSVEVNAPQEYQGAVLAGLTKRNAIFLGSDANEGYFTSYSEVRVYICTYSEVRLYTCTCSEVRIYIPYVHVVR